VTNSIDPHEITTRMAAKLAHGEALTDDEQRQLDDARAVIMNTPEIRAFEDAMWRSIAEQFAESERETRRRIERIRQRAIDLGACDAWPDCGQSCERCIFEKGPAS